MSADVVSLHGFFAPGEHEPDEKLIAELERLIEAARSGEIVGLAGVYVNKDKVVSYSYSGVIAGYGVLGGIDCLKQRVMRDVLARE